MEFNKYLKLTLVIMCMSISSVVFAQKNTKKAQQTDRQFWVEEAYKMSKPILQNMSQGKLKEVWNVELSPTWDNRDIGVAYTEAFGRLMAGIAPWLALPDDNTPEGQERKELREWALQAYANAVDPKSPDYLSWKKERQTLVDAAYIAESFIRAPKALWDPLSKETKERYIKEFKELRKWNTPYNNWVLFRAMIEAFLLSIGEQHDGFALEMALKKMDEWYLSDGWYSDGPEFSQDYYNAYVISPMLVDIIQAMADKKIGSPISLDLAKRRMNRYNTLLERQIAPDGTFPVIGRSMTYRLGAFQPLALSALQENLPKGMTNGQVRNALTTTMKKMFGEHNNYDNDGFLVLGFAGHQPFLADYYTNSGSMYITSLVFLPLGLPADAPFWTDAPEDWTTKKAWAGEEFPKDYHTSVKK